MPECQDCGVALADDESHYCAVCWDQRFGVTERDQAAFYAERDGAASGGDADPGAAR